MSRFDLHFRQMYPSIIRESTTIETKSMGRIHVGYEIKARIDASKNKLKKVR